MSISLEDQGPGMLSRGWRMIFDHHVDNRAKESAQQVVSHGLNRLCLRLPVVSVVHE
jgi:hypothetical protein